MKTARIPVILLFLLGIAVSSHADTIGPYELKYRQTVLANVHKEYTVTVALSADSLLDSDTLYISRANCPGSERAVRYAVLILDSTRIYKTDEFHGRYTELDPYKIPLTQIISRYKLTGKRDYSIELYYDRRETEKIFGTIHLHLE